LHTAGLKSLLARLLQPCFVHVKLQLKPAIPPVMLHERIDQHEKFCPAAFLIVSLLFIQTVHATAGIAK
jgi:hypothetical protein